MYVITAAKLNSVTTELQVSGKHSIKFVINFIFSKELVFLIIAYLLVWPFV
jgi:hypothetical protein